MKMFFFFWEEAEKNDKLDKIDKRIPNFLPLLSSVLNQLSQGDDIILGEDPLPEVLPCTKAGFLTRHVFKISQPRNFCWIFKHSAPL